MCIELSDQRRTRQDTAGKSTGSSGARGSFRPSTLAVVAVPSRVGRRQRPRSAEPGRTSPEGEQLRIQHLGGFQVMLGARRVADADWYLRKVKNLIKLLALVPDHRLHRDELRALLWPEMEPEAASTNLHKALHI